MRLNKRIRLIQGEILEIEGGASSEQVQAPPEEVKNGQQGAMQTAPEEIKHSQQPTAQAMKPATEQPEEDKVVELDEKQLRILGIIQGRLQEYKDAIEYVMKTLKNNRQAGVLLPIAENLKKLEKKIIAGGVLTKEEASAVKAVSGELLFGYNEQTRIQSKLNLLTSYLGFE